jgi:chromosome segregation ATPase
MQAVWDLEWAQREIDVKDAEIAALKAEIESWQILQNGWVKRAQKVETERDSLRAELSAAREDTARLDWLSKNWPYGQLEASAIRYREDLRAAIDAARMGKDATDPASEDQGGSGKTGDVK